MKTRKDMPECEAKAARGIVGRRPKITEVSERFGGVGEIGDEGG
jgi:hypothetical protein